VLSLEATLVSALILESIIIQKHLCCSLFTYALHVFCARAELLAQELKELQAELGDYNTVTLTVIC